MPLDPSFPLFRVHMRASRTFVWICIYFTPNKKKKKRKIQDTHMLFNYRTFTGEHFKVGNVGFIVRSNRE